MGSGDLVTNLRIYRLRNVSRWTDLEGGLEKMGIYEMQESLIKNLEIAKRLGKESKMPYYRGYADACEFFLRQIEDCIPNK